MAETTETTAEAGEATTEQQAADFEAITSQEEFDRRIAARLDRERKKFADYDEFKAKAVKLAEIEEANQSELEKALARAEKAEQAAADAADLVAKKDREVLIGRIAAEKKVPAKYLSGDSEEALVASADEFLADIQGIAPDPKPGHVPSAGTGDPKPSVSSLDTGRARAQALLQANS